jgi:ribosomal protein S12 methylthiotransferase accessory factor
MLEREFAIPIAEEKILKVISSLSLTPFIEHTNSSPTVAICTLRNSVGSTVAEGAGKGMYCRVGALAESVEHYVLDNCSPEKLISRAIYDVCGQPSIKGDGILVNLPASGTLIDCAEMEGVQSDTKILVPAALLMPNTPTNEGPVPHETSFLARYATNSGIAFGCSEQEALLHGLNEALERHMFSKILMSLCGQHEPIALNSLNVEMSEALFSDHLEFYPIAAQMKIIVAETIHGVYFSMAIPKRPDGRYKVCPVGSGCSLDARTAIKRAATELHQTMLLYDDSERDTDYRAHTLLNHSSALRPLIQLEALRNVPATVKRLEPARRLSVADQIDLIIEGMSTTGLKAYQRTLSHFPNGCAVMQIYVPGLERFNLIRSGVPVIPQHLLHANSSLE